MHLPIQKIALVATGTLFSVSSAARALCSASSNFARWSEGNATLQDGDSHLSKRVFTTFPTRKVSKDSFMVQQVGAATNVAPSPGDNNALFRSVGGDSAFSLGVNGLVGCTSLIVMSEKGVYFTHFWEDISFKSDADFQRLVLDLLRNGGTEDPDNQQSLASHAADFRDVAGARAIIVTPAPDDDINYTSMTDSLLVRVNDITGIQPTKLYYSPLDGSQPDPKTAQGRGLYQYDPKDPSDNPTKAFRFIYEYDVQYLYHFG